MKYVDNIDKETESIANKMVKGKVPKTKSKEPTPKGKITAGCQFPLGEPPYSWCGADTVRGASTDVYCEAHYIKCYRERIGVSDRFELEPGDRYFRPLEEKQRKLTRALNGYRLEREELK